MNNNDIFKDLFVLEMTNNHLGSLERGMKIIDEFSKVAVANKSNKLSAASDFVDLIDKEIIHSSKGRI